MTAVICYDTNDRPGLEVNAVCSG